MTRPKIRAVVFDIGGVLEHTPRTGWPERWEHRLNLPDGEIQRRCGDVFHAGSIGAAPLVEVEAEMVRRLGLSPAQLRGITADLWQEYLGSLNIELAAYFARLRPRYLTGILSNSFVGAREREQTLYGFEDMCDVVVYSHEEGVMKPDAELYRIVCDRLDVAPEETLFLDDVPANVAGAERIGMYGVLYASNEQAIAAIDLRLQG